MLKPWRCVKGPGISLCTVAMRTSSSDTRPTEEHPSKLPAKALQYENRFPSSITHETATSYISVQTWETCKHAQLYPCGKSQFPSDPGPHSTEGTEAPAYINGAFLSCGGKPRTHTAWREHTRRATPSQTPTIQPFCKCQTIGEMVYLGVVGYFYTFVTASLSPSHPHAHTHTSQPMKGKRFSWCATSLCTTRNKNTNIHQSSETSCHVFAMLNPIVLSEASWQMLRS